MPSSLVSVPASEKNTPLEQAHLNGCCGVEGLESKAGTECNASGPACAPSGLKHDSAADTCNCKKNTEDTSKICEHSEGGPVQAQDEIDADGHRKNSCVDKPSHVSFPPPLL